MKAPEVMKGSKDRSSRRGFVVAILASLMLHGLAVAAIYQAIEPKDKVETPKVHMVVVDLVSFKKGASSDKKTLAERQSAPEIKSTPEKNNRGELPQKEAKVVPFNKQLNKPDSQAEEKQLATQVDRATKAKQSSKDKAIVRPLVKKDVTPQVAKKETQKPQKIRSKKLKVVKKQKPVSKTLRKKKRSVKKQKTASSKGRSGQRLKKKGRSKSGRTQGASYKGPGLSNPRPQYPRQARQRRQQGRVLLRVSVSASGRTQSVRISRSSGYTTLDRAALVAVRRWRFRPARRNGKPIRATVTVPIKFRLRN